MDSEFTELDVQSEVQSPTDKSSKSKGFLSSFVSGRNARKNTPPVQDPTFKDFTYFCEDPDALVEVSNLVSELHTTPPPPPPLTEQPDEEHERKSALIEATPTGTPLSSFVENGHLNFHGSPDVPLDLKKLELSSPDSSPCSSSYSQYDNTENGEIKEVPAALNGSLGLPPVAPPSNSSRTVSATTSATISADAEAECAAAAASAPLAVAGVVVEEAAVLRPLEVTVSREPMKKKIEEATF